MCGFDEYVQCPFDKSHRILKSRWQYHITVCAKKNAHLRLRKCQYDVRHYVKRHEYYEHLRTCPSKPTPDLDRELVTKYQTKLGIIPIPSDNLIESLHTDENWDENSKMNESLSNKRIFKDKEKQHYNNLICREEQQEKLEKEKLKSKHVYRLHCPKEQSERSVNQFLMNYSNLADIPTETQNNMVSAKDCDKPENIVNERLKFNQSQGTILRKKTNSRILNSLSNRRNGATTTNPRTEIPPSTDATTSKICWTATPSIKPPFSFADAIKKNASKPSITPFPTQTNSFATFQLRDCEKENIHENNSSHAIGSKNVSIDGITKKCSNLQIRDYIPEVINKNKKKKMNNKKTSWKWKNH